MNARTQSQGDAALLREIVTAYAHLLATCEALRLDSQDLDELVAIASVHDELTAKHAHYRRCLTRLTDRAWSSLEGTGGGAGGGAPGGEGARMPRSAVAAGAARKGSPRVDIIHPDNSLFLAPAGKELPGLDNRADNQTANAGERDS
jgi:hypothetical protein